MGNISKKEHDLWAREQLVPPDDVSKTWASWQAARTANVELRESLRTAETYEGYLLAELLKMRASMNLIQRNLELMKISECDPFILDQCIMSIKMALETGNENAFNTYRDSEADTASH